MDLVTKEGFMLPILAVDVAKASSHAAIFLDHHVSNLKIIARQYDGSII